MSMINSCRFNGRILNTLSLVNKESEEHPVHATSFQIAVRDIKSDKVKNDYRFQIAAFGQKAKILVEYCKKGDRIDLLTYAKPFEHIDIDGRVITRVEFVVEEFEFLEKRYNVTEEVL